MRLVIDTNVLIYDTVEDSEHHEEAEEILENNSPWLIPLIVIYETIWFFIKIKLSLEELKEVLLGYLRDPRTKIINERGELTLEALDMLIKQKISPKNFNDMLILNTAIKHKAALATFDKKLKTIALKNNVKVLP